MPKGIPSILQKGKKGGGKDGVKKEERRGRMAKERTQGERREKIEKSPFVVVPKTWVI